MNKDLYARGLEPTRKQAERKWKNFDVAKRFKEDKAKREAEEKVIKDNSPPEIAEVIETEKPKADRLTRFQNKFTKEIREMLEGYTKRNELKALYARAALLHRLKERRRILLGETELDRLKQERARRLAALEIAK